MIFTAGGFTQTVKFINDSAIATFDVSMAVSDIEAIISGEIRKSAHFDIPITEGYTSTNREFDPGFEKGEAYNNPDPVIPNLKRMIINRLFLLILQLLILRLMSLKKLVTVTALVMVRVPVMVLEQVMVMVTEVPVSSVMEKTTYSVS